MPKKIYHVYLTEEEREYLKKLVSRGTEKARKLTRARILLLADESEAGPAKKDREIVESLGVCMRTVAKTRERYFQEGLEAALEERPRPGGKPKLTGRGEAMLTAIACSDPPEGYGRWTIRLLADKLVEMGVVDSISRETVRRALKKTSLSRGRRRAGA